MNIDPRPAARRVASPDADVRWRPGIEVEVNGFNDLARSADVGRVDDYHAVVGSVAWCPEVWWSETFGLSAQVGIGAHDSRIARTPYTTAMVSEERGVGGFVGLQLAYRPLTFVQVYGRAARYLSDDLHLDFTEIGAKVQVDAHLHLFAAYRDANLDHVDLNVLIPDFDHVSIRTDGVTVGVELRF